MTIRQIPLPTLKTLIWNDPDNDSDLKKRADEVETEKKLACPKGHETGVREIGSGKYFCLRCGRVWTNSAE